MTDNEVICAWMELEPRQLTLDALWRVEERLRLDAEGRKQKLIECLTTDDKAVIRRWVNYALALNREFAIAGTYSWHATPEQKIKALATVLRPIVQGKEEAL